MEQFDFKIFEFQLGQISGKDFRLFTVWKGTYPLYISRTKTTTAVTWNNWSLTFNAYPDRLSDLICFGKVPSIHTFVEHEEKFSLR